MNLNPDADFFFERSMNFVWYSIGFDYNLGYSLSKGYWDICTINRSYITDILILYFSKNSAGTSSPSLTLELVKMENFRLHPSPTKSMTPLKQDSKWFLFTLNFEKHCPNIININSIQNHLINPPTTTINNLLYKHVSCLFNGVSK